MKLFEYWTELPYSITQMFPELPSEIVELSNLINKMAQKIISSQAIIIDQIEEIQMNKLSSIDQILLSQKLGIIEREKTNLAYQAIKNTTKILLEASKNLERVSTPSKENLTQIKLSLKITRSILDKINEESSFAMSNKNSSEAEISNKSKSSSDVPLVNCNYNEKTENNINNQNSDNFDEISGTSNFLTMFSCFIEKIQSKLFMKSNDLLSALIQVNQKPDIQMEQNKQMEQMENKVSMLNLNEFRQKLNSKPNSCKSMKNVNIGKMIESTNSESELQSRRKIKRKPNPKLVILKKESNFRKKNSINSAKSFNSECSVDYNSSKSTTNNSNNSNFTYSNSTIAEIKINSTDNLVNNTTEIIKEFN